MVFGAHGALGSEILSQLKKENNFELIPVTRKDMDLCGSFEYIEKFIKNKSPHLIINCAAFLGIENCYKNKNDALLINTFFPNKLYCISKQLDLSRCLINSYLRKKLLLQNLHLIILFFLISFIYSCL